MKKVLLILCIIPMVLYSQTKKEDRDKNNKKSVLLSAQAKYSNLFTIEKIYFNKSFDLAGKGETLEVVMVIKNKTNNKLPFYLFVLATNEVPPKALTSFDRPIPQKDKCRLFVPYPNHPENFTYPLLDSSGKQVVDFRGKKQFTFFKVPKNPRDGVDAETGKPYILKQKLVIRTKHLSKYRNSYSFFNHVTVIIFDEEIRPLYKQIWHLKGRRT
jgi:hypothetical protein